jgi:hypothetical protein
VQQATLPSTGLTAHNNYWNVALSNTYAFSPTWLGTLVLDASLLHLTQTRNSDLGFALAFPFSSTALTVSGFETFGDNQFATPITLFPTLRNQDKYQMRYDLSRATGDHSLKFGVNFIHEPMLGGAFTATDKTFIQYINNPDHYAVPPTPAVLFRSGREGDPPDSRLVPLLRRDGATHKTFRDSDFTLRFWRARISSRSTPGCVIRRPELFTASAAADVDQVQRAP